jgi:predicted transcriptional regulator
MTVGTFTVSHTAVNPKFTQAIILKSRGYSAREIAEMMHDTERNIYYFIAEAKKIGAIFKSK